MRNESDSAELSADEKIGVMANCYMHRRDPRRPLHVDSGRPLPDPTIRQLSAARKFPQEPAGILDGGRCTWFDKHFKKDSQPFQYVSDAGSQFSSGMSAPLLARERKLPTK
jgi:hypothetical protein